MPCIKWSVIRLNRSGTAYTSAEVRPFFFLFLQGKGREAEGEMKVDWFIGYGCIFGSLFDREFAHGCIKCMRWIGVLLPLNSPPSSLCSSRRWLDIITCSVQSRRYDKQRI